MPQKSEFLVFFWRFQVRCLSLTCPNGTISFQTPPPQKKRGLFFGGGVLFFLYRHFKFELGAQKQIWTYFRKILVKTIFLGRAGHPTFFFFVARLSRAISKISPAKNLWKIFAPAAQRKNKIISFVVQRNSLAGTEILVARLSRRGVARDSATKKKRWALGPI